MKQDPKKIPRERNHLVALAKFRRAGVHAKTSKAIRKSENQKFNKRPDSDYFLLDICCV